MRLWQLQAVIVVVAVLAGWGASSWQTVRLPTSKLRSMCAPQDVAPDELARNLCAEFSAR